MNVPHDDLDLDFIEKYYPNYYQSDDIALNNDLAKLVHREYEEGDCAHELLLKSYGGNINDPQIKLDWLKSNAEIFEKALENSSSYIKNNQ